MTRRVVIVVVVFFLVAVVVTVVVAVVVVYQQRPRPATVHTSRRTSNGPHNPRPRRPSPPAMPASFARLCQRAGRYAPPSVAGRYDELSLPLPPPLSHAHAIIDRPSAPPGSNLVVQEPKTAVSTAAV